MGSGGFLPLSSPKMCTEQKWAAVKLLLFFIRSGGERLFEEAMGRSLSQLCVGGAGICCVLAPEGNTKANLWSCLISSLRKLQQWCVAEVRHVGVRCGAGCFIYKSLLLVFYPCLSLSLFVKA